MISSFTTTIPAGQGNSTPVGANVNTNTPDTVGVPNSSVVSAPTRDNMPNVGFSNLGVKIPGFKGDITLIAGDNISVQPQGDAITFSSTLPTGVLLNGRVAYQPLKTSDAKALVNTLYYSTTTSKLTYKDPGGTLHTFY